MPAPRLRRKEPVPFLWAHSLVRGHTQKTGILKDSDTRRQVLWGAQEGSQALPQSELRLLTTALCPCSMDKDSPDIHQDLNALKAKFQEMRKVISSMPGIHLSPEQQQQQLHSLREQVRTKSELLQKYKSLCMFEVPKE